MSYKSDLYDAAVSQGYTSAQVRGMTYAQVATVCSVTLGPNGESPGDFFFRGIRRAVANRMDAESKTAQQESRRQAARDAVRAIWPNATAERFHDDAWIIRRNA